MPAYDFSLLRTMCPRRVTILETNQDEGFVIFRREAGYLTSAHEFRITKVDDDVFELSHRSGVNPHLWYFLHRSDLRMILHLTGFINIFRSVWIDAGKVGPVNSPSPKPSNSRGPDFFRK